MKLITHSLIQATLSASACFAAAVIFVGSPMQPFLFVVAGVPLGLMFAAIMDAD